MARLLKHDASSRVEIRWQADAFVKKVIEYWASNVSARKGTIQLIKIDQGYTAQMSPLARCETREAMTMIQWNYAGEDQIFAKSCDCKMCVQRSPTSAWQYIATRSTHCLLTHW